MEKKTGFIAIDSELNEGVFFEKEPVDGEDSSFFGFHIRDLDFLEKALGFNTHIGKVFQITIEEIV